tara:strand:+ start:33890 stop:33997 length:108 start_codon:yes stop_codon:yes gene_type:complete
VKRKCEAGASKHSFAKQELGNEDGEAKELGNESKL